MCGEGGGADYISCGSRGGGGSLNLNFVRRGVIQIWMMDQNFSRPHPPPHPSHLNNERSLNPVTSQCQKVGFVTAAHMSAINGHLL